jgi:hypothetical protein
MHIDSVAQTFISQSLATGMTEEQAADALLRYRALREVRLIAAREQSRAQLADTVRSFRWAPLIAPLDPKS